MENRLEQIYESASRLFINRGYSRTQIKDIAKDMGLSAGMLYIYFSGKRDILNFTLKCTVDPGFLKRDLPFPVQSEEFAALEAEILAAFEENLTGFARGMQITGYSFPDMASDAFDIVAQYGKGCLIIENNPLDVGIYFDYYLNFRTKFFKQVYAYVSLFMDQGGFRRVEHPLQTCQLIVETIAWWAMHVSNDAFEPQRELPLSTAKAVCLDNLLHAYNVP